MRRIIILTEGHTEPHAGKTAACIIRYKGEEVVALLDATQQGKTSGDLLGVGQTPIVGKLDDAPEANTLLLGIAPPAFAFTLSATIAASARWSSRSKSPMA